MTVDTDTSVTELVGQAVAAHREGGEQSYQRFLATVGPLRERDFEEAAEAIRARSGDPQERAAITELLGRLPLAGDKQSCATATDCLRRLLDGEKDECVLQDAVYALAWICDASSLEPLLDLLDYPSDAVREAVATSLASAMAGEEEERGIAALITLSADRSAEVRDWACFALGTLLDCDGDAIREALAARLDDPCDDTRCEAVLGLARRGDERGLQPLRRALDGDSVLTLRVDSADETDDPGAARLRRRIAERWPRRDPARQALHEALRPGRSHTGSPAT